MALVGEKLEFFDQRCPSRAPRHGKRLSERPGNDLGAPPESCIGRIHNSWWGNRHKKLTRPIHGDTGDSTRNLDKPASNRVNGCDVLKAYGLFECRVQLWRNPMALPRVSQPETARNSPGGKISHCLPNRHCHHVIIAGSVSDEEAKKLFPQGWKAVKPYLRVTKLPGS